MNAGLASDGYMFGWQRGAFTQKIDEKWRVNLILHCFVRDVFQLNRPLDDVWKMFVALIGPSLANQAPKMMDKDVYVYIWGMGANMAQHIWFGICVMIHQVPQNIS